jgi:hypothetical protein
MYLGWAYKIIMKNYLIMKSKSIITTIVIIICVLVLVFLGGMLGAGPYGYAQQYEFNVSKDQLIKSIERFKSENIAFDPPQNSTENDTLDTLTTHFNVKVYYPDERTIVYFFINDDGDNNGKSFINLVSVDEGLNQGNYKLVNRDFDRSKNLEVKKEFEDRILNKLKLEYKDKGNGMFIFWK